MVLHLNHRAPVAFSGPDVGLLPKNVLVDPIESAGSVMLIDATHPLGPWPAGVANGTMLPNIFEATADTVIGAADHRASIQNALAGKGVVERSTKGGIHTVVSPTLGTADADMLNIVGSAAIKAFMKANPAHEWYMSFWGRYTKIHDAATVSSSARVSISSDARLAIQFLQTDPSLPSGTRTGVTNPANTIGPKFGAVAGITRGDWQAVADSLAGKQNAIWVGANRLTAANGKSGGNIVYRVYMEDLTVSGRPYATVVAIDQALYTKHVLTSGGRYYGDTTPTDPTTVA